MVTLNEEPARCDLTLREAHRVVSPYVSRAMLAGYDLLDEREDGACLIRGEVKVIVSAGREGDGRMWVHLSVSLYHGRRLPQWATLVRAKECILGEEAKAILVVPPRSEHVNIAEVHHLWSCPEGDGLPDFTRGTGSL